MVRAFLSEDSDEDEFETLPRHGCEGEAPTAVIASFPSPTIAIAAAIRISNRHDRARRHFLAALTSYNAWLPRLLRLVGWELPRLRRRLTRARHRYIAAQEALEGARQNILVARNVAKLVDANRTAPPPAQAPEELVTREMDRPFPYPASPTTTRRRPPPSSETVRLG